MEKKRSKNILLSYEEHAVCSNWVSDYHIGFKQYNLNNGDILSTDLGKGFSTICFILKGEVVVKYNDREYNIGASNMFFIPASIPCEIRAKSKVFLLVNNFNKPINTIIDTCERMSLENIEPPFNKDNEMYNPILPIRPIVRDFLLVLTKMIDDGVYCKHFHNEEFNKFFFMLRFYYSKEEIGTLFAPILGMNMEFKYLVLKHYNNISRVKELAEECGFSLATFNRLFAENFHDTPYKWMQKKKLQQVISRLSDKEVNIAQVAAELGFSSSGHLTVFCKEFLHLTPSQFRKQQKPR